METNSVSQDWKPPCVASEGREMAQRLEDIDHDMASRKSASGFVRISPEKVPSKIATSHIFGTRSEAQSLVNNLEGGEAK
ncbi:MAG: hypothetical protein MRY59_08905 [Aquisalinus sp.]|nr:hypothetical protein [Aquisalinus sp.]